MANGNVKIYVTSSQDELKTLAKEGIDSSKADTANVPSLPPEVQTCLANAEKLFQNGQYLETMQETIMAFLVAWGASKQRADKIRKEATDFATQVLNQVKQEISVPDENRVIQTVVTDVLATYMWAIADGPFSVNTPLNQLAADLPAMTAEYVEDVKKALTTP